MLNITKQSDYGIILLASLKNKTHFIPLSDLITKTKLPKRYLARIASQLAQHKLIISREGKIGGYKLAKNVLATSLFDYLKIFEGELNLAKCQDENYTCKWEKICHHKNFLTHKLSKILNSELKKITLGQLLE